MREPRLIRPLNYPILVIAPWAWSQSVRGSPAGARMLVINLLGRVHMEAMDDPFAAVDKALEDCPLGLGCDAAIVDMHCEATSEKMAMGHFCDGRASLVVGTHTHVPTADGQILNGGTAYQTDAGACADYDSVIGNQKEEPLRRFTTRISQGRYHPRLRPGHGVRRLCRDRRPHGPGAADRAHPHRRPAEGRPSLRWRRSRPEVPASHCGPGWPAVQVGHA